MSMMEQVGFVRLRSYNYRDTKLCKNYSFSHLGITIYNRLQC